MAVHSEEFQARVKEIKENTKCLGNISDKEVQKSLPIGWIGTEFSADGIEKTYSIGSELIYGDAEMFEDESFFYAITADCVTTINKRFI